MPELAAFFSAIDQEFPRVLEIVAVDDFAQDAFGRDGRAVGGQHQGDFALRHDRHRDFDNAILPAPEPEMQSRRENVGLVTGFAIKGDQTARRQGRGRRSA